VIGYSFFTTLKAVIIKNGKRSENISITLLFIIEQSRFGKKGYFKLSNIYIVKEFNLREVSSWDMKNKEWLESNLKTLLFTLGTLFNSPSPRKWLRLVIMYQIIINHDLVEFLMFLIALSRVIDLVIAKIPMRLLDPSRFL